MALSGLQREVLSLYRQCLRACRQKPALTMNFKTDRASFQIFARAEFERNLHADRRSFAVVEFLLRKGRRRLDLYSAPGVRLAPHHF